MLVYSEPATEAYYALMIISSLLALIMFRGKSETDIPIANGFWSVSLSFR